MGAQGQLLRTPGKPAQCLRPCAALTHTALTSCTGLPTPQVADSLSSALKQQAGDWQVLTRPGYYDVKLLTTSKDLDIKVSPGACTQWHVLAETYRCCVCIWHGVVGPPASTWTSGWKWA